MRPGFSAVGDGRSKRKTSPRPNSAAAVDQQHAVAVVDARARLGRRNQPAQHRRDALRIDREVDAVERVLGGSVALAGLQFEQLVRIDGDRGIGFDRGRRRDGAGDDLALHQQALDARVDQAGAELRQVDDADREREQSGDVERNDAAGEAGKALGDEELPGMEQQAADAAQAAVRLARRRVVGAIGLDGAGAMSAVRSSTSLPGFEHPPAIGTRYGYRP